MEPAMPAGSVQRFGDALAWVFFAGFVITVCEVLMRYVFKSPTTWVHETTTTLCAIGFAFGGAYAQSLHAHMRVSSLVDRMPAIGKSLCYWLSMFCGVIYLAGLGWGALAQTVDSVWRFENGRWLPEPMPGPPGWPLPALVKTTVAAGTLLFLAVLVWQAVSHLRRRG